MNRNIEKITSNPSKIDSHTGISITRNCKNIIDKIADIKNEYINNNDGKYPKYLIMGQVSYYELIEQFYSVFGFITWNMPDLIEYSDMKIAILKNYQLKNFIDVI